MQLFVQIALKSYGTKRTMKLNIEDLIWSEAIYIAFSSPICHHFHFWLGIKGLFWYQVVKDFLGVGSDVLL